MKTLDVIIKTISETTQLSSIMSAKNSISSSGSSSSSSGGKFGRLTTSGPHETTRLLLDSARVARETEQIGEQTAQELRNQREMIEESGENLDRMKQIAQTAQISLRKLHEKIFMKKIFLWSIILLLLAANIAVIVALIQNHGKLFAISEK